MDPGFAAGERLQQQVHKANSKGFLNGNFSDLKRADHQMFDDRLFFSYLLSPPISFFFSEDIWYNSTSRKCEHLFF
jgi:hypothetical protein